MWTSVTGKEFLRSCFFVLGEPLDSRRISKRPCPHLPDLDAVFEAVMQKVRQKFYGAIAPIACVQAVRAAAVLPFSEGMKREQQLMSTLFTSGQARALQYSFFAQRAVGRWSMPSGASWNTSKARPVHRAAVLGERQRLFNFWLSELFICVTCSRFLLPVKSTERPFWFSSLVLIV